MLEQKITLILALFYVCSRGRIRTDDQLVTRNPHVSIRRGLYHHPAFYKRRGQGASASE